MREKLNATMKMVMKMKIGPITEIGPLDLMAMVISSRERIKTPILALFNIHLVSFTNMAQ